MEHIKVGNIVQWAYGKKGKFQHYEFINILSDDYIHTVLNDELSMTESFDFQDNFILITDIFNV